MPNFKDADFPPLSTSIATSTGPLGGDERADVRSSKAALATVNDLPDELLLCILHYLPGIDLDHFHLASLVNLSRTNRRFHRLVAEELYATFNSHFCEPYLFLRTVISNDYLAGLIRHVEVTYGKDAHSDRRRYGPSAQDKKIIKEGMKALGLPDWKSCATECNAANAQLDTLYMAILMHTPKVSSLRVVEGELGTIMDLVAHKWPEVFKGAISGTSLGSMHRFQSLQSLHVVVDEMSTAQLSPLFRIPSLRKIHLSDLFEYEHYHRGKQAKLSLQKLIPQRSNNLDELHLTNTFLQVNVLAILVSSAKKLQVFNHTMALERVDHLLDEDNGFGPTSIMTILRSQQDSLESLTFNTDSDAELSSPHALTLRGDLKDFTALKHLSCPLGTIVDSQRMRFETLIDKLPLSLVNLHILIREHCAGQDKDAMPSLEQLADTCAMNSHKNLKRIKITVDTPGVWFRYDWSRIIQPLSQTNVEVEIEDEDQEGDGFTKRSDEPKRSFFARSADAASSEDSDEESLYSD
jgi:hypothetical protein